MPGCVLRVQSRTTAVERLLRTSRLKSIIVFRKGEPRAPGSTKLSRQSGFNVDVSRADGALEMQTRDAVRFLRRHAAGVSRLRRHRECAGMTLDFGVYDRATTERPWPSYHFPASLIELAGRYRIDIELSFCGPESGQAGQSGPSPSCLIQSTAATAGARRETRRGDEVMRTTWITASIALLMITGRAEAQWLD